MTKKYFKEYLKIGEMKIKTTSILHLIPVRIAKIKRKKQGNKCLEDVGKGKCPLNVREITKCQTALEISVGNSLKANVNLLYDPAIPLLGICPKDLISYSTGTFSAMFIAILFTIARTTT